MLPLLLLCASTELRLSLDDALARAATVSPEVSIARMEEREAEATRVGAGVFMPYNPRLYGEARPAITGPFEVGFGANLEMPFEVSGASFARIREAKQRASLAKDRTDFARFLAHFDVWERYVAAQVAADRARVLRESIEVAKKTEEAARVRVTAGASSDIDVMTAETELAELEALAAETEVAKEHALLDLKHALDIDAGTQLVLSTSVEALVPTDTTRAMSSDDRPELVMLRQQIELLAHTDDRLRREGLPRISIFTGVDAAPVSPMFGQVGLSVELPIAQRNQGPRAVLKAQRETAEARVSLRTRELAREVDTRLRSFQKQLETVAVLDARAIPAAARNLELVTAGWRHGRFDVFRLTTAARQFHRLRLSRVDAVESTWRERIALARAMGALR